MVEAGARDGDDTTDSCLCRVRKRDELGAGEPPALRALHAELPLLPSDAFHVLPHPRPVNARERVLRHAAGVCHVQQHREVVLLRLPSLAPSRGGKAPETYTTGEAPGPPARCGAGPA